MIRYLRIKILYLLAALILSAVYPGNAQGVHIRSAITGDRNTDLSNLLLPGKKSADVMDGMKQDVRQEELTKKFQAGVQQNYEWFVEYLKTVPEGQPMPYHVNLGIQRVADIPGGHRTYFIWQIGFYH